MSLSEARSARCEWCAQGILRSGGVVHERLIGGVYEYFGRCTAPSDEELYAELEKQVAELMQDRERLDWLSTQAWRAKDYPEFSPVNLDIRGTIDFRRNQQGATPGAVSPPAPPRP